MTELSDVTGIELEELPQPVSCPHCGHLIGWRVERDTVEVFQPWGDFLYASLDLRAWYCGHCDKPYRVSKSATKRGNKLTVDNSEACE